eukprot:TRINITY_DN597_c0_g1_i23.p1 TRINITY_DN597_c0_g1~~TRINITY_DN597_c0_g1_i23.p1  ORF type:complete len:847 (+),score=258.00 TRINITY_DN597_c0_g1_i23:40-2580(+)
MTSRSSAGRGLARLLCLVVGFAGMCSSHTLSFGDYSYKVSGSPAGFQVWTTAPSHKITVDHALPSGEKGSLFLSAARHEFEPLQVIIQGTTAGSCAVELEMGTVEKVGMHKGGFVDGLLDTLTPLAGMTTTGTTTTATLAVDGGSKQTVLWLTVYVPYTATVSGMQTGLGKLRLTPPGSSTPFEIPIDMYVYNFQLSAELNYVNHMTLGLTGTVHSDEDVAKQILFDHRMTPKGGATWPSGFNYQVAWETNSNPDKCSKFYDEPNESPPYSLHHLAPKYVKGEGWNCAGFPIHMAVQFVNNNTPRPTSFCGESVGSDPKGTPAYNAAWGKYIGELGKYVKDNGYGDKVFYYTMNEPQDAADDDTAVALCELSRSVAPDLMICVSEEPKPEIAERCAYDIWASALREYNQTYAWKRQEQGIPGERVWLYSLPQDPDPYPNPSQTDRQGMHSRIWGFLSWSLRTQGYWYYDAGTWFNNKNPTVRLELFREAWEDYEYLWLANGKKQPKPCTMTAADVPAFSVAKGLTDWTTNDDALMSLRHQLGLYLEGSIASPPSLVVPPSPPPAPVYINFQGSSPSADPLVVGGNTYVKMGWDAYDPGTGIGWEGQNIGTSIVKDGYQDTGSKDELWYSYLFDDYGRDNVFKYPLNPGTYEITVAVGRPGKTYNDKYNVVVNGVKVIDNYHSKGTGVDQTQASIVMEISSGLSVVWGGKDDGGSYAYTFIAWMTAVPSSAPAGPDNMVELECPKLNIPVVDERMKEPSCRPCFTESFCGTKAPETPLPPGQTYVPPTPAPDTAIPATPLPPGQSFSPSTVSPGTPSTQAPNIVADDGNSVSIPVWVPVLIIIIVML